MKNFLYPTRLKLFLGFSLALYVTLSVLLVSSLNTGRSLGPLEYSASETVFLYLAIPGSFLGIPFFFCVNTFHNFILGLVAEGLFLYIFSCFLARKKMREFFTSERIRLFLFFLIVATLGFFLSHIVTGHVSISNYISLNYLRDIGILNKNTFLYILTPLDFLIKNLPNILLAFLTGVLLAKKFNISQKKTILFFVFLIPFNPLALLVDATILSAQIHVSIILFLVMLLVSTIALPIWGFLGYRIGRKSQK